jgi:hypothetical protein
LILSWSVRFLIGGGGNLDRYYGLRAFEIDQREITTGRELREKMRTAVPNDAAFIRGFQPASVRRSPIARYYLRASKWLWRAKDPEMVPSQDTNVLN